MAGGNGGTGGGDPGQAGRAAELLARFKVPAGDDPVATLIDTFETLLLQRNELAEYRGSHEAPGWNYDGAYRAGDHLSDAVVAGRVRMLMRGDLDHESVCVLARDRIRDLSREVAVLKAAAQGGEPVA